MYKFEYYQNKIKDIVINWNYKTVAFLIVSENIEGSLFWIDLFLHKKKLSMKQKMFVLDIKAKSAMADYNKKGYTFICTEVGRNKEESFMNLYKRVNLLDKRINYLKECKSQIKET